MRASTPAPRRRDLQRRLADFAVDVCAYTRQVRVDHVTSNIAQQLARSATAPAANYAEAQGAESRREFVHKLQLCLKELRETAVWLYIAKRTIGPSKECDRLINEVRELVAIFVACIRKAKGKP